MKNRYLLVVLVLILPGYLRLNAQPQHVTPGEMAKAEFLGKSAPLKTMHESHPARNAFEDIAEFNHSDRVAVPYNFPASSLTPGRLLQPGPQKSGDIPLLRNFAGLGNENGSPNPDTQGDVGPNHYIQVTKSSVQIWDKSGNSLYGPADLKTIFSDFPGPWLDMMWTDPITLYDPLSDRWLLSSMLYDLPDNFYEMIAVSDSPDPLGAWNCFALHFGRMPDYPKFGVWPDGYYLMFNEWDIENKDEKMTSTFIRMTVNVFNREELQTGVEDPTIVAFHFPAGHNSTTEDLSTLLPADLDGIPPPDGTPNFLITMKDDAWGYQNDMLWLWECKVDWDTPANSMMQEVGRLPVTPFETHADQNAFIPQPGTATRLHSHTHFPMYRLQYRNFGDHQSMVFNHTIDADSTFHAGIRWYELRDEGSGWNVHQEGTWFPTTDSRWMGSIAMDADGNVALGYSVSSDQIYPSIRVTGRHYFDNPGEMTQGETEVATGAGNQGTNPRWGDYSMMSVDPVDGRTFWYTQMYLPTSGPLAWKTRIAAFRLDRQTLLIPDTLFFNDYDTSLLIGKTIYLKNTSPYDVSVQELESLGYFPATGANWFIDDMPELPFGLAAGDSIALTVKIDMITDQAAGTYYFDQIDGSTDYGDFHATVAIDGDLLQGVQGHESTPVAFTVSPNPFSESTLFRICTTLTQPGKVEIFDSRMQLVGCVPVSSAAHCDGQSIRWDGKGTNGNMLPAGIYLARLRVGDAVVVRKIIRM